MLTIEKSESAVDGNWGVFDTGTEPLQRGLHQDGRRLTPQRLRILELFERMGAGRHLSAETCISSFSMRSKVSLATIYRTCACWWRWGFSGLELSEAGRRFELLSGDHRDHHHLVCIRCGL